ncbi:hypothetical protein C7M61_002191 [Candidozyma pseudohaemuli]|uniref:Uncharacterized protein n=1 Tax=Candidozyma pseudohaemuli TaxID=418784 RepID=A0A2P7YSE8_9ASCO|nr:hypothetical protein C7M61_002191 [[Candida] pseudohaemulonii]PSK38886.1 hypothetical protein C7M61_002191 [[Candida] pseudohaemulonii]
MVPSPLVVPKQRSFAAKPVSDRRRLSDSFYKRDTPRAVSESPRGDNSKKENLLQKDLKRSLRYNMDLSSAVASYVPGLLELEDIPVLPVYNRATGKFRVFSTPTTSQEGSPRSSNKSITEDRSFSSQYSDGLSQMFGGAAPFDVNNGLGAPDYRDDGSVLGAAFQEPPSQDHDILQPNQRRAFSENHTALEPRFYSQPRHSSQTFSLDPRRKTELPPLPRAAADSVLSGSGSELFSSGSNSGESSLEPDYTPRQRKPELLFLDEVNGGFLGHVARRSVSTISTCKTLELGTFMDEPEVVSVMTNMDSIASEGSLWQVLDPEDGPEQSLVTPEQSTTQNLTDSPATPEIPQTPELPRTPERSAFVSQSLPLPPFNSSTPQLNPSTPKSKELPPVPTKSPKSNKKVAFCLDLGAEYDKSRFMIPNEYKLKPKKKNVKPRAVSQPNPVLQPFYPASKRHSQPIPVAEMSAISLPAPPKSQPVSPNRLAENQPIPFRTNVRIRGGL